MCGKLMCALVVAMALAMTAGQALGSPYDRVAYWDGASGTAWAGDGGPVRDALQQAGYRVVNATELKAWMDARIADRKLSVVVMCRDVVPASVAETQDTSCTIRRYLDAGGKVVWYSDWPFYYRGTTGTTWGANGASQVLGFNASSGPNDQNQQVTITEAGQRWGLTTPWNSMRPTSPTITPNLTVLATDNNGNAAGWVKHYLPGDTFRGFVRIDDHSGAPINIPQLMAVAEYLEVFTSALEPVPSDGATDVPRDVILGWMAGEYAATHDVYFGANFADVNDASRADPKGVLASQNQTATEYDQDGLLEYGTTYYWRIDEVNGAPDNTVFKGDVWHFTVEPYAYPITSVAATASSAQPGMGAQNAVNGAGLNAEDQHSTESTEMWMATGAAPNWIQFEFDKVYKLHELLVWNSNQLIEAFIGFGAKNVTIEYSTDGTTWTTLEGVPEFAQANGSPTYTANTTVDLKGAMAKFVKLTINSNWGGGIPQTGLSEVRFFAVPVQAREPIPADGATAVSVDAEFNWRPGREATSHEVLLGTDEAAVAADAVAAQSVTDHSYAPAAMEFGTEYFWKVNELGGAGPYAGDVWSFVTEEYAAIDDMESYNDDDHRIYESWIDGLTTQASGSQVGYDVSPFAEKTIKHGGAQSMPLMYDNSASPFVSEAEQTFDTPQNWSTNGADSLVVWFRGQAPGFVQLANGNIAMSGIGADIWNTADEFRFAYKTLNGDGTMVARVESIINSDVWAKGGVMIRQSIEPSTVHAFMPITASGGNGASFQHRLTLAGASTNNDNTGAAVAAPYWVKIERKGNAFSGFISPDGKTWTQLGTAQTITMTGPVLIGLALCSHNPSAATAAEFSNISTTGNVTGNWELAEIGVAQPVGNSIEGLYLSVKDSAGKTKVVQHPDPSAAAIMSWQQWQIPLSEFTSAGVKMNAVKSLVIGVGNKAAPTAGGTGTIYIDDISYGRPASAGN